MTLRSLLITPTFFPRLTGNAVTVGRVRQGLSESGITCRVLDLEKIRESELVTLLDEFQPRVIHNFHACKSGRMGLEIRERLPAWMITTMTGTDINIDIDDPVKGKEVMDVLAASDRITVFNDQALAKLVERGIPPQKVKVIHQSVLLPQQLEVDYRNEFNIYGGGLVFLLMGTIRRVKEFSLAIDVLSEAREKYRDIHLFIAGPPGEEEEFDRIMKRVANRDWIKYLGGVPREKIRGLFQAVDVLLNTSLSESESNAILEAMYFAKLVIARDIPGNASLINSGTGLLFNGRDDLLKQIVKVLDNRELAKEKGIRAKELVLTQFSYERERDSYLSLYRERG
ncbi:MAG: glycosyltransferase, partial [Smithellaceae bacterium]|nr:glycosyltransferase [Smithellaceae bacterium]